MNRLPRITFGIIVLNGEPFTRYNLRSLYPFAHEIIVVEGASPKAAAIATQSGHSVDGTLDLLHRFASEEDPDHKTRIFTAEDDGHPNGFWPGEKDEQSQAYARRATGDYLWQVDIDEFYKPDDINAIMTILREDPKVTQINIQWLNFWGGFDFLVDGIFLQKHYRDLGSGVPRLFKWGAGYRYITHRPPTVVDSAGTDTRKGKWITGDKLARKGIYCYHYANIFHDSVKQRMKYYSNQNWSGSDKFLGWYDSTFARIQKPFRVHHVVDEVSWLTRFSSTHPPQIEQLIRDLRTGICNCHVRDNGDVEQLLRSKRYTVGTVILRRLTPLLLQLQKRFLCWSRNFERTIEGLFSPHVC
jgi:hypothetical protein